VRPEIPERDLLLALPFGDTSDTRQP